MEKLKKNISRVSPENSRKQHSQGFSVDKVFTDTKWDINTCDEEYFEKQ
jgi:hypothetical protein